MPKIKSAKKALRQSFRRRALNVKRKNKYKNVIKDFKKSVTAKDFKKASELLPKIYKALDKAAKKNTIDKNKASRNKSRLARLLAKNK